MCIFLSLSPLVYVILYAIGWFSGGICTSKKRLDGKTVVITGGDTGIGFETALDLARRGARRIILGCLDMKNGEIAAKKIRSVSNQHVDIVPLNLANFSAIRKFANIIDKLTSKVDILVNNAGSKSIKYVPIYI